MPHNFDDVLRQAAIPDTVTEGVLDDLKQEVVRDVSAVLIFGIRPATDGQLLTAIDRAESELWALSTEFLYSDAAAEHLARIADELSDAEGALHFGCLLNLAHRPDGALWWWQFAAGAGNAIAAYCLYLFHLLRGELRDAHHWAAQAHLLDANVHLTPPPSWRLHRLDSHTEALRDVVERLKVDEINGIQFHHPDQ
ncbi:hypothetical protein [Streptomyces sp. NPDC059003]|uniref:hypothetical protein n=1 Tax=Streptomyces sp. NPDC059003 TaxID=3346691 RepID=UPI0036CB1793